MADTFTIKVAGETQEFESNLTNLNSGMRLLKSEAKSLNKSLAIDPGNAKSADALYRNLSQQLKATQKQAELVKQKLSGIDPKVDLKSFVATSNQLRNLETESGKLQNKLDTTFDENHKLKVSTPKLDGKAMVKPLETAATQSGSKVTSIFKNSFKGLGNAAGSAGKTIAGNIMSPIKKLGGGMHEILVGSLRQAGASLLSKTTGFVSGVIQELKATQTASIGLQKAMQFKGIGKQFEPLSQSLDSTVSKTNISAKSADKFASVLVSMGKSAKKTSSIISAAAKANQLFGGSGESFDKVSSAISKVMSSGNVATKNIVQLSKANGTLGASVKNQLLKNYEKAGGKQAEFSKALQKGKLSASDFNKALMQVSQKGGKVIQTLPDAMAGFKKVVASKLQPVFNGIMKSLSNLAGNASNFISKLDFSKMKPFFATLQKLFSKATKYAVSFVKSFDLSKITTAFKKVNSGLSVVIKKLFAIVGDWAKMVKKSGINKTITSIFAGIIEEFASYAKHIVNFMGTLIKSFKPLASSLKPILKAIAKDIKPFFGMMENIINPLIDIAAALTKVFMKSLMPSLLKFNKAVAPLITSLGPAFTILGHIFKAFAGIAKSVLVPVFSLLGKAIGVVLDIVTELIKAFTSVVKAGESMFKKVSGFFGFKNGGNIDAKVKNFKDSINNSSSITNATQTINVTPNNSADTLQIARQVAKLIRTGVV